MQLRSLLSIMVILTIAFAGTYGIISTMAITPGYDPGSAPVSSPVTVNHNLAIKYSTVSTNQGPIIQMNQSWKRASKNEPVSFDAGNTYVVDGYIAAYSWDFGDGSMGEGKTAQHAYRDEGRYSVRLTVIDDRGFARSAFVTVLISDKPPISDPGNDTSVSVGTQATFNGTASYDPDGKIMKYEWSFGDGASATGAIVTHAYSRPDTFKVNLKVTDDNGQNATAYMTVVVTAASPTPTANRQTGGLQGMILLAGAGIVSVLLLLALRRKSK